MSDAPPEEMDPLDALEPPVVQVEGPLDFRSLPIRGLWLLAVFYTLYVARDFLLPVVWAGLLTILLAPVVRALRRRGLPEPVAAAALVLGLLGILGFGVYRLAGPAQDWIERAPTSLKQVEVKVDSLKRPLEALVKAVAKVKELSALGAAKPVREVALQGPSLPGLATKALGLFGLDLAATMVLLFFLLAARNDFLNKVVKAMPSFRDKRRAVEVIREVESKISAYIFTVALINLGLGAATALAVGALGLPSPLLWGTMVAAFNFIPYLGATASTLVLTLASILSFDTLGRALLVPGAFVLLAGVEGNLVTPYVLGRRLLMNPVTIFLSLLFWGWLWGVPGALLAVPILVTVKVFCDHHEGLKALGDFIGE